MKNPEAIAWTIAADGYVTLRRNHNSFQPRVGMANTSADFINKFCGMVGDIGHVYYYKHKNPKHRGKYFWELYSIGDCMEFLLEIEPYLPIKQEQASITITYCIRALDRIVGAKGLFRGSPEWKAAWKSTEEDWQDYYRMKELNQRGVV